MLRDRLIRRLAAFVAAVAVATASSLAQAQDTKVSFQLDWRFEGPAALFLLAKAKGYFAAEKLDVTIDAGNGSGNAVNRVASGTYQMGFADLAALIEFVGNNPTAPNKPVAVMMVYDDTPAAVFALKKAGITKPADLVGQEDGCPGVRRRAPRVPDLRQGQRHRRSQDRTGRRWTRRCARRCWPRATSTRSPASTSRACSTSTRAASRTRTSSCCRIRSTA